MFYTRRVLPALQCLDAELAHDVACATLQAASKLGRFNPFRQEVKTDPYECMGLTFPNRVGLAAGMDKNGDYIEGFQALGLGFLELGSVTFDAQNGNPKPRVWVDPRRQTILNRMGMPNKSTLYCALRVADADKRVPIGISIAPTTGAVGPVTDLLLSYQIALPVADFITINLSCPNVPGISDEADTLRTLAEGIKGIRKNRPELFKPTLVKAPRGLYDSEAFERFLWRVRINGFTGVVCCNSPHRGGKAESGNGLLESTLCGVRRARNVLGPDAVIIASGGIMCSLDAVFAIRAGANLVQTYSGLVYAGPSYVPAVAKAIQDL